MNNLDEDTQTGYETRRFKSSDRDAYLDLHDAVFGDRPSDAWFDWKYTDNPYVDHVSIFVTECGGELVGARSFFALPLRVGDRDISALQPCDTMVHPDHRRRGLFMRMTKRALSDYARAEPAISFNFPNKKTLSGNLKLGWELVENLPVRFRFQNPAQNIESVPRPLGRVLATGCRLYNRVRERHAPVDPSLSVTRHSPVPATDLAALTDDRGTDRFHIPRDRHFYMWRYGRPDRTNEAFIARHGGEQVGSAVVSATGDSVRLLEFVPSVGRPEAVSGALIRAIVRRYDEAEFLISLADDVDPSVLASFGHLNGGSRLLKCLVGRRPFVVRPIGNEESAWTYDGLDIRAAKNWMIRFGDFDVY